MMIPPGVDWTRATALDLARAAALASLFPIALLSVVCLTFWMRGIV